LDEENKPKGSSARYIGLEAGKIFSLNLLVPMTSKVWVNSHLFKEHPRDTPLITNQYYLACLALVIVIYTIGISGFVSEKKIHAREGDEEINMMRSIKLILRNTNIRSFIAYLLLTRSFEGLINDTCTFKMVELGFDKNTLILIFTLNLPVVILVPYLTRGHVKTGTMLRKYHGLMGVVCICITLKYSMTVLIRSFGYTNWIIALAYIESFAYSVTKMKAVYLLGFRNVIVDEELGSTSTTLFTSTYYMAASMPNSIGLKLAHHINWDLFALGCIGVSFTALFSAWGWAKELDATNPEE